MQILETFKRGFSFLRDWIFHPPDKNGGARNTQEHSRKMENSINLWHAMYVNDPPWASGRVKPLGIPAAICRELANPVLLEFTANITGGERAAYLLECFQDAQNKFRSGLEMGLALGMAAFKPIPYNGRLIVDISGPSAFRPTRFAEDGTCTGGAFKSRPVKDASGNWYVKIEYHDLTDGLYTISNRAFMSSQDGTIGAPVELRSIEAWSAIEPDVYIYGLEKPLFSCFKPPLANNVDANSDEGVSIYGGAAVELIRQADEQWEKIKWEYHSGRRKIYMDGTTTSAKQFDRDLFEIGLMGSSTGDMFEVFSPEFRDDPLYRGFQNILKLIEFNVGLAYGTLSDPQSVEKTATEIRNSKQRMYVTVDAIQKQLEHTFDGLIYAMDVYATLYGLAPAGEYEASWEWGDSILNDEETRRIENQEMRSDVAASLIRPELYIMKKYGVSEEEALAMMPGLSQMIEGVE